MAAKRVTGSIRIVERKRGDQWYAKWRDLSGKQHQRALGLVWRGKGRPPVGHLTRKMAEDLLRAILVDAGRAQVDSTGRPVVTLKAACEAWLQAVEHEEQREPSTIRDYESIVRVYLYEEFGKTTAIGTIDEDRIDEWRVKLLEEGRLSRRTIQKAMTALHSVYAHALRKRWVDRNPVAGVKKVRVQASGDFNVLAPEQVFAVARTIDDEQLAAAVIVAAFTGLRLGEVRALRWRDVDFAGATVHVRRNLPHGGIEKAPKSGKVRSVPLIDQAAAELDRLSRRELFTEPDDRVFTSAVGGPLPLHALPAGLYAGMEAAKIDRTGFPAKGGFTWHDLRHTFGTLAVQAWPLADVQAYMGHAQVQTTMIYVHHVPKTDAAAKLGALVAGQTGASDDHEHGDPDAEDGSRLKREGRDQ
jgi:integrase